MEIELRAFTEEEYHEFFRGYEPDPAADPCPFTYDRDRITKSYAYNHSGVRKNYAHYGVFSDRRPVGSFQLKRIDSENRRCEFGIILQNERVRNRGIGTEAIRLGMAEARDRFGIRVFTGDTMAGNNRMQRVFEKIGFRLAETEKGGFRLPDGSAEDRLVYEIILSEEE